jgi:hypothetical protein
LASAWTSCSSSTSRWRAALTPSLTSSCTTSTAYVVQVVPAGAADVSGSRYSRMPPTRRGWRSWPRAPCLFWQDDWQLGRPEMGEVLYTRRVCMPCIISHLNNSIGSLIFGVADAQCILRWVAKIWFTKHQSRTFCQYWWWL